MKRIKHILFICCFVFFSSSCIEDSGLDSENSLDQILFFQERSIPFIDGKTGSMISQTGIYEEYIVYDDEVDTMRWNYPPMIVLTPNTSGNGHIFIWQFPKLIDENEYEEIMVEWWAWVFKPESLETYFPQFQININDDTDPNAPDSIGYVSVCRRPTDINSFLPSPEEGWYNYKTFFNYPEFEDLDDRIYLTLIRPKNHVVIFGVLVKGEP